MEANNTLSGLISELKIRIQTTLIYSRSPKDHCLMEHYIWSTVFNVSQLNTKYHNEVNLTNKSSS